MIRVNLALKRCQRCKRMKSAGAYSPSPRAALSNTCDACRAYSASRNKQYRSEWSEERRESHRRYLNAKNRTLRLTVINHYGGKCACCGEARIEFLALDHPDNDGAQDRRDTGKSGLAFYVALMKDGYRKKLRVLCHNCNLSRGCYGYCPHEAKIDYHAAAVIPASWKRNFYIANTDLTDDQVLKIRERRGNGEMIQRLASEYNLNVKTIRNILNGNTFKHVAMPEACARVMMARAREGSRRRLANYLHTA